MTTRISTNNLDATVTASFSPKISNIQITDNSYTVLDDTAVSTTGGYIVITGTNFVTGCTVLIGSVVATSVSFVNSTTVRAQVPAQAAGSYTVYLTNPDGGVAIRVNGLNYSATPSWSTTSPLPAGQTNSAISIQLSATSTGNVSYALQAGSSLPAGVTLSNVGLLSGTVTGITVDTTYNFTVVATDTELQDTPQAFSITITASDANFKNVSLLLSANTPTTPFVSDASANAFNVTVAGDTRPNSFGPYTPGYYSFNFTSKTGYISVSAVTNLTTFTGDFTFETWVYPTDAAVTQWGLWDSRQNGATANAMIFKLAPLASPVSGSYRLCYYNGSELFGTGTLTVNQWSHVAFVRSGTTMTFYINGVAGGTATVSGTQTGTATTNPIYIGSKDSGITEYGTVGYISNYRVVNGTAVYTGNFTPSTSPLTAVANTVLLIAQSNRYIDNSTNAYTLTNSSVSVAGFDPFVPASNTATYGSAYLDGTGDNLQIPYSAALAAGTSAYSFEIWVYFSGSGANQGVIGTTGDGFAGFERASGTWAYYPGTSATNTGVAAVLNQWNHVVICRNGSGAGAFFVNGTRLATFTDTANKTGFGNLQIGYNGVAGGSYTTGYVADYRYVKGNTAYDPTLTTLTVPTAPLTAISGTMVLICQTNQSHTNNQFVDRSTNNFIITRNGNTTQGTFSPYAGTWSNYFDGTGDYLTFTGATTGSGNFTTEAWVYLATLRDYQVIFDNRATGATATGYAFGVDAAGKPYMYTNNGFQILSSIVITANSWNHVALVRNGTTITIYVNGVGGGTYTSSANFSDTNNGIGIAPTYTPTSQYFGYISNLRIVNGTAVYTSAFTPPIQPLIAISGTTLLTCADNRFIDDSNNKFTLTRTGDVSIQKFSPFTLQTQIVPTSYSVYFDGTGDYLSFPANSLLLGSNNFTMEAWVYLTASPSTAAGIFYGQGDAASQSGSSYGLLIASATTSDLYIGSSTYGITSPTPQLNQWVHIAWARTGGTFSSYLNGSRVGTRSDLSTLSVNAGSTSNVPKIGAVNAGSTYNLTGYISNARIIVGSGGYDATQTTITVPTTPLTAITNTSLLTCQSTTIIDNSTNNLTITVNGNSQPLPQNPFGYTNPAAAAYTTTALGGSMYFDGTGDYLNLAANAAFDIVSGDFTVQCWTYNSGAGAERYILSQRGSGTGWELRINSTNTVQFFFTSGSSLTSTGTIPASSWTHIAVTRSGNTVRIFINGAQDSSATFSNGSTAASVALYVGNGTTGGGLFLGYLSDVSITKGQALYTSAFVPPAAPVTAVRNTVLLLSSTAGGIVDSSMNGVLETVGDVRVNTSIVKFAVKPSIAFDGTGDYLYTPGLAWNFNSTFTFEFWFYPTSLANAEGSGLAFNGNTGSNSNRVQIGLQSNGTIYLYAEVSPTNQTIASSSGVVSTNQWYHAAFVRSGNTLTIYLNGTSVATSTITVTPTLSNNLYIGFLRSSGALQHFTGYMTDVRITTGVARYTTAFTAPSSPAMQF